MKLHVGSGTVYLQDYVNVDLFPAFRACERPDLVARYSSTDDDYYARHRDKDFNVWRGGPQAVEYICDVHGSFLNLPVDDGSVKEILARQSFEHLSVTEARKAMIEMNRVLVVGGILRLDVPDTETSLRQYRITGDDFYLRHLLGPRNSDFGYHMMSWTPRGLNDFVCQFGFDLIAHELNIHSYPAFALRWTKKRNV